MPIVSAHFRSQTGQPGALQTDYAPIGSRCLCLNYDFRVSGICPKSAPSLGDPCRHLVRGSPRVHIDRFNRFLQKSRSWPQQTGTHHRTQDTCRNRLYLCYACGLKRKKWHCRGLMIIARLPDFDGCATLAQLEHD